MNHSDDHDSRWNKVGALLAARAERVDISDGPRARGDREGRDRAFGDVKVRFLSLAAIGVAVASALAYLLAGC